MTTRAATLIQITQREALFDKEGKALFKSLEKNIYGAPGSEPPVSVGPEGLVFRPTHMDDHLATPFIDVSGSDGAWVRVHCTWPAEAALRGCDLYVQDDRCNQLVGIESGPSPHGSEFDRWFEIPALSAKVRVVMTAKVMEAVVAPKAIRIERVGMTPGETSDVGSPAMPQASTTVAG